MVFTLVFKKSVEFEDFGPQISIGNNKKHRILLELFNVQIIWHFL